MNLTSDEKKAIEAASPAIGEHLEALGKTDFAQFSEAEWHGFLEVVFTSICTERQQQWAEQSDGVPV